MMKKKNKKIHFEISERKVLLRVFDIFFVLFSLSVVSAVFEFNYFSFSGTNYYWSIVLALYLTVFGSIFEMYNLLIASKQLEGVRSVILTSSTTVFFYLLTPVLTPSLPSNRFQILVFYFTVLASLLFWRIIYVKFFASHRFLKSAILVCDKSQLNQLVEGLGNVDPHYRIVGFVDLNESESVDCEKSVIKEIKLNRLSDFLANNSISEIVVASGKTEFITKNLYENLIQFLQSGVVIREYYQLYEELTQRIPVQYLSRDFHLYFPFSRSNQNRLYLISIRIFEIVLSIIGLTIAFMFFPLLILGNLIANRGPVFYTQERVGQNGKIFNIYKYRTMVYNAEIQGGAVFAMVNDLRVTPFGKFMRKTRIDEFPQFFNILKGDMSFIGPRPERPVFTQIISEKMPFYETRHIIKPGLTGWAQVNYNYGTTLDDSLVKLQYDLYYIKYRNIFMDIDIMLKTLTTVLFYRGH
ncbi:MAG: sugar transferase [Flavobacterium sp.]